MSAGDVALLLELGGILLIYAEFNRPGTILLGAAGALLFMLGVAHLLPLRLSFGYATICLAGLVLILLGLRSRWQSWLGAGALAGMLGLILGLRNLVQGAGSIHWITAAGAGTVFSVVTYVLGRIAVLAARNKRLPARPHPCLNLNPYGSGGGKGRSTE